MNAAPAFVDDDCLSETVLRAHPVRAPEELQKAKAAFEDSGSVAERTLDGLPEAETTAVERDGTGAGEPFAWSASVSEEVEEAEIEQREDDVARLMKVPNDMNGVLVEDPDAPEDFKRRPEEDGEQEVDGVAEKTLPEGGEGQAFELFRARGFVSVKAARA